MNTIAYLFSDLHLENWRHYNQHVNRLSITTKLVFSIIDRAYRDGVPLLFCGDLIHRPSGLESETLMALVRILNYAKLLKVKIYAISGNHDQASLSVYNGLNRETSKSYLEPLAKAYKGTFYCTNLKQFETDNFYVSGIPYITSNTGYSNILRDMSEEYGHKLDKPRILLIHTDLYGAIEPNGHKLDTVQNIPKATIKFFGDYNLVASGHIHKPQHVRGHIYMLGPTTQQRTSDINCQMGYWALTDTINMKFIPLSGPKFIEITEKKYNKLIDTKNITKDLYIVSKEMNAKIDTSTLDLDTVEDKSTVIDAYIDSKFLDEEAKTRKDFMRKYLSKI